MALMLNRLRELSSTMSIFALGVSGSIGPSLIDLLIKRVLAIQSTVPPFEGAADQSVSLTKPQHSQTAQTFVENPINTFPYLLRPAGKAPWREDSLKKVEKKRRSRYGIERTRGCSGSFKSEDYPFKNTVLREAALPPALKIELLELWQRYRNFKGPFSTRGRVPMNLWVVND
jgi:hypothetical protein